MTVCPVEALDYKAFVKVTAVLGRTTSPLLTTNVTLGTLGVPASPVLVVSVAATPTHASMTSVYYRHC